MTENEKIVISGNNNCVTIVIGEQHNTENNELNSASLLNKQAEEREENRDLIKTVVNFVKKEYDSWSEREQKRRESFNMKPEPGNNPFKAKKKGATKK